MEARGNRRQVAVPNGAWSLIALDSAGSGAIFLCADLWVLGALLVVSGRVRPGRRGLRGIWGGAGTGLDWPRARGSWGQRGTPDAGAGESVGA
jgi:hypothetical protein